EPLLGERDVIIKLAEAQGRKYHLYELVECRESLVEPICLLRSRNASRICHHATSPPRQRMKLRKNLRTLLTPSHFPDPSGRRRPHHPAPASSRRRPAPPPTEGGGQGLSPRPAS